MIVDGIKYSCLPCVKGHRSAHCPHGDRPLVEVKKKGRPPTQCAHCRELRKERKIHLKCCCVDRPEESKAPLVLPNGVPPNAVVTDTPIHSTATSSAAPSTHATPSPPAGAQDSLPPNTARPHLLGHASGGSTSSAVSNASEPSLSSEASAIAGRKHAVGGTYRKDVLQASKPHAPAHGHQAAHAHHAPSTFSPYPHLLPHHAHSSARSEGSKSVDDLGHFPSPGPGSGTASAPHAPFGASRFALPPLLTRSPSISSASSVGSHSYNPFSAGAQTGSSIGTSSAHTHPHSHLNEAAYPWANEAAARSNASLPAAPTTPPMSEEEFLKAFEAALGTGTSSAPIPATTSTRPTPPDTSAQNDEANADEFTFGTAHAPSFWPEEVITAAAAVASSGFDSGYAPGYAPSAPSSVVGGLSGANFPTATAFAGPSGFDLESWARATSNYAASVSTTGTNEVEPSWQSTRSDYSAAVPSSAAGAAANSNWEHNQQQALFGPNDELAQLSLGAGGGFDMDEISRWRHQAAYMDVHGGGERGGWGAPLMPTTSNVSHASWTSAPAVPSSLGVKQESANEEEDDFDDEFEKDPQEALNHPHKRHPQLSPDQWLSLDDAASTVPTYSNDIAPRRAQSQASLPPLKQDPYELFVGSSAAQEAKSSLGRAQSSLGLNGAPRTDSSFDLSSFPDLVGPNGGTTPAGQKATDGETPRYSGNLYGEPDRIQGGHYGYLLGEKEDVKPDISADRF